MPTNAEMISDIGQKIINISEQAARYDRALTYVLNQVSLPKDVLVRISQILDGK